ncbi:hypothetical protein FSP39_010062 [Pinctada imbricata]|uniref:Beta-glucuronidase n=1 Tax=Pinctada imbricata TaxID=66713 RepID=A0AA88YG35_PINIB|nr:hypothetical protein FSP39_010062 [Pinctada imbricata]
MLYPRQTWARAFIHDLTGMWNFRADDSVSRRQGFDEQWYLHSLSKTGKVIPMPVPSSYNDITQDKGLRDFVGWAWYDTEFYFPRELLNKRIVLRLDSVHYNAIVWVNGQEIMRHDGGHLPFEGEILGHQLSVDDLNRITVAVNNTLTPTTLPPGEIIYENDTNRYPPGYFVQKLQMDFFNYAGIHRSVKIYTTPKVYVNDITLVTDYKDDKGFVNFNITTSTSSPSDLRSIDVVVRDAYDHVVGKAGNLKGTIDIPNPNLWWPWTMNTSSPAYLYKFEVTIVTKDGEKDNYLLPFGIRTINVTNTQLLINDRPFYCHGVAKHEDSDIRGKGLDFPLIAKDFNLLKWLGTNCIRTSHYPYAEEIMDQCDRQGIVVIDECPGVGITKKNNFGPVSLSHHLKVMEELVQRDKNRPSVIMWSTANEPDSALPEAVAYFRPILEHTKALDPTRPVTFVANQDVNKELVSQYVDVICINRYNAWYTDCSHTELIQRQLGNDLHKWHGKFNKPIIVAEYGADTIAGLHQDPSFVFTEEYQIEFMNEYHQVFDSLRGDFLVGEMVWNFADFMTKQEIIRVVGNKKGVFTRQRQPKMSAHLLRSRYYKIINSTDVYKGHSGKLGFNHYSNIFPNIIG